MSINELNRYNINMLSVVQLNGRSIINKIDNFKLIYNLIYIYSLLSVNTQNDMKQ